MKEYVIEYSFGGNDKVRRIVESGSDDLELIMMNNTSGDAAMFEDVNGHFYTFNYSDVKYMRIFPHYTAEQPGE